MRILCSDRFSIPRDKIGPLKFLLGKTVLHEIRVSGTVLWSLTNANYPTYTYISQKRGSGNRVSDFRVSGGPPVHF